MRWREAESEDEIGPDQPGPYTRRPAKPWFLTALVIHSDAPSPTRFAMAVSLLSIDARCRAPADYVRRRLIKARRKAT